MTAQQLAKAIPFSKGEKKTEPLLQNVRDPETGQIVRTYKYPGTYQLTIQMLGRLFKEGKVKRSKEVSARDEKVNVNASYVWSIVPDSDFENQGYSKDKRIPIDPDNKDHELDCADFLVSLLSSIHPNEQRLSHWDYCWTKEERDYFRIDKTKSIDGYGVNYDRHFIFDGREFFLEVDRGTKNPEYVYEQFRRYKRFIKEVNPAARVLITAQKYRFKTDQDRATQIWKILADLGTGNDMFVALHRTAIHDPLAPIWRSAANPDKAISIEQLSVKQSVKQAVNG